MGEFQLFTSSDCNLGLPREMGFYHVKYMMLVCVFLKWIFPVSAALLLVFFMQLSLSKRVFPNILAMAVVWIYCVI
jgi:hypothetical protein